MDLSSTHFFFPSLIDWNLFFHLKCLSHYLTALSLLKPNHNSMLYLCCTDAKMQFQIASNTAMTPGVNFINVFTYKFFVRTLFWQLFLVMFCFGKKFVWKTQTGIRLISWEQHLICFNKGVSNSNYLSKMFRGPHIEIKMALRAAVLRRRISRAIFAVKYMTIFLHFYGFINYIKKKT